jgi:hypothetical protein
MKTKPRSLPLRHPGFGHALDLDPHAAGDFPYHLADGSLGPAPFFQ